MKSEELPYVILHFLFSTPYEAKLPISSLANWKIIRIFAH